MMIGFLVKGKTLLAITVMIIMCMHSILKSATAFEKAKDLQYHSF